MINHQPSQTLLVAPALKPHSKLESKPIYGISFIPTDTIYPLKGIRHEANTIEWLWRMFNTLPKARPQLRNSQNAAARLLKWRTKSVLPPRRAYTSTVDYYEAFEPLYCAKNRFNAFMEPKIPMNCLAHACRTILPKILF